MIYWLHPCASITAMWLRDNHIESQRIEAGAILGTAAQLCAVEESLVLVAPKKVDAEMLDWVLESSMHYAWMLQYYSLLCIASERNPWKEIQELKSYCSIFPDTKFRMLDDELARKEYSKTKGIYKRNRAPWWLKKQVDVGYLQDAINEFDPELF